MTLERYSHVMHLTSQVAGDLADGKGPIDVLRATFPAGTVSGAPKVRAMEIIDELEPTKRGPYAGVVGYVDFSGNLDTAIAIRTMVWRDGQATLQAGAGIVADSVPADEDLECRNKAQALLTAAAAAARDSFRIRSDHERHRSLPASTAIVVVVARPRRDARSCRASCRRTSTRSRWATSAHALLLQPQGKLHRRLLRASRRRRRRVVVRRRRGSASVRARRRAQPVQDPREGRDRGRHRDVRRARGPR